MLMARIGRWRIIEHEATAALFLVAALDNVGPS